MERFHLPFSPVDILRYFACHFWFLITQPPKSLSKAFYLIDYAISVLACSNAGTSRDAGIYGPIMCADGKWLQRAAPTDLSLSSQPRLSAANNHSHD